MQHALINSVVDSAVHHTIIKNVLHIDLVVSSGEEAIANLHKETQTKKKCQGFYPYLILFKT